MALIPANRIFHHVTSKPTSVSRLLQEHFKVSSEKAEELFRLGSIYFNKRRIFSDISLPKGAYLRLHLHPKRFPVGETNWAEQIVVEEQDFIIVKKPAGIPTHATVDNALENTLAQVRLLLGKELFVTQRLDTPVSGLILFAKNKKYQAQFNTWLSERKVKKTYLALVEKECALGRVTHFMEPSERSPKVVSSEPKPGWLPCELSILSCSPMEINGKTYFELKIDLHTGRTHQIRAQLGALGCPILGDRLYGSKVSLKRREFIALMSLKLIWPPQNQKELSPPYFSSESIL